MFSRMRHPATLSAPRTTRRNRPAALLVAVLLASSPASADYLGLTSGRTASVKEHEDLSIDIGVQFSHEYQNTAVRINRKFNDTWIGHASIGIAGRRATDALPISIGALYSFTDDREFRKKLRTRFKKYGGKWNLGARAAAGFASFDNGGSSLAASALSASLLASTRVSRRSEQKLKWYADVGLQWRSREVLREDVVGVDSEVRLAVSAGIIHPFLVIGDNAYGELYGGEAFFGISTDDGITFSAGMRFNFK